MHRSADRNIYLYPIYRSAADAMAWLPVFFLYFSERLSLPQVLLLEAIYYLAVVLVEVPSGYMSDVVGRRKTLLLSSVALVVSYLFFLFSGQFAGLAVGQCFLAISIAARSGTDTALHFESLKMAHRDDEYGDREAKAGKFGFAATAIAALAGGVLGSIDLTWAYWLSLLSACAATYIVWCFVEPEAANHIKSSPNTNAMITRNNSGFGSQLLACVFYLKQPFLKWLFLYSIFMYAIVHIPYEFYQPYLALLEDGDRLSGTSATLIAGILFALTATVASLTSAYSMTWQRKIGLLPLLTWAAALELAIIAAMAILLHPLIAISVILRSGPMAVITAPVNAAKAPLINNEHRATYLSIESLLSRLLFAVILLMFSVVVSNGETTDWISLATLLRVSSVAGVIGLGLLLYYAVKANITAHHQNSTPQ